MTLAAALAIARGFAVDALAVTGPNGSSAVEARGGDAAGSKGDNKLVAAAAPKFHAAYTLGDLLWANAGGAGDPVVGDCVAHVPKISPYANECKRKYCSLCHNPVGFAYD